MLGDLDERAAVLGGVGQGAEERGADEGVGDGGGRRVEPERERGRLDAAGREQVAAEGWPRVGARVLGDAEDAALVGAAGAGGGARAHAGEVGELDLLVEEAGVFGVGEGDGVVDVGGRGDELAVAWVRE